MLGTGVGRRPEEAPEHAELAGPVAAVRQLVQVEGPRPVTEVEAASNDLIRLEPGMDMIKKTLHAFKVIGYQSRKH